MTDYTAQYKNPTPVIVMMTAVLAVGYMACFGMIADNRQIKLAPPVIEQPKPIHRDTQPPAKSSSLRQLSDDVADVVGIRPGFLYAVMMTESGGRQSAKSNAGALGRMQLMPRTAKMIGVDPHDPEQNVLGGALYLKRWVDKYRDETLALLAYNQGPTATDRWLARGGHWHELPKETRDYVSKVNVNAALSERVTQLAMEGE